MSTSDFEAGLQAADQWFAGVAQRLAEAKPYLVPSLIQETLQSLPAGQHSAFLEGVAAIIVTSLAWGPAAPGKFESFEALRLMSMSPEAQRLEDEAAAKADDADFGAPPSAPPPQPKREQGPDLDTVVWCLQGMEEQAEALRALASAIECLISADEDPTTRTLARIMRETAEQHRYQYGLYKELGVEKQMEQGAEA